MVASSSTSSNVTIIQSSLPMQDAETVLKLFSDLFELESSTDESVVLTSTSSTSLFFLHANPTTHAVIPLIASNEQVETARELCDDSEDVQVNSRLGDCTLCLVRLKGGSSLLLTPTSLAATRHGRVVLTRALIKSIGGDESSKGEESDVTESGDGDFDDIQIERESSEESNGGAIMEEQEYPLAKFPSLAVGVFEKNDTITTGFPINSQDPVPVETDLFKGKMLMLLKPVRAEDDPYWTERLFSKKKRRFVFQLQGKLKRVPEGTLYAGGEISNPMQLGLVAKGICGLLLKFIKSVAPDIHYSFGDSKEKEKAHIVVPAWSFFERLVVTKPGEEPPEMGSGEEFDEPKESIEARASGKIKANWNTEDTYSMSFYTMYLDIAKWQVVQVPVTSDINLKTFWGNSFLRIVLFENTTPAKDGRHLQVDNTYYFAIELRHLSVTPRNEEDEETPMPWEKRSSGTFRVLKDSGRQDSGSLLAETYEDDQFFDAEEENSAHEIDVESMHEAINSRVRPSVEILSKIDTICPAMIEIVQKGKYTKTYAFNLEKNGSTVFRTASSVEEYFAISSSKQAAEQMWSPRLSSSERCRRILGQTISKALMDGSSSGIARLSKFAGEETTFDSSFLKRTEPSWVKKQKSKIRKSGYGARALSDRHWMEEWIQVSDRFISFHNPEKQKGHFRISLQSIVQVKCVSKDDSPLMSPFSFISIGTLGRTIYVMFSSPVEAQDWVDLIVGLVAMRNSNDLPSPAGYQSDTSVQTISFDDPSDEFLIESSMWNCKQRRILNGRQLIFHSRDSQTKNPIELMETSLVLALEQSTDYDEQTLIDFLNSAAALKDVDVHGLDEKERLAFFLNLYHTMIMHAFLVLGPPDNSFKWISYFNTIAYQCSDDVFSLTELEHCVIRAAMSYPSQIVSKFVLPKSTFSFALSRPDYRVNFALNCGSLSNPEFVPVYKAETLNEQLDQASRWYMKCAADVRVSTKRAGGVTLILPKICNWFADDFGNGSTNDVVQCVERFLKDEQRKVVASCYWKHEKRYNFGDLNVKYASYSFECRNLKLANNDT